MVLSSSASIFWTQSHTSTHDRMLPARADNMVLNVPGEALLLGDIGEIMSKMHW